jgi:hypothetical protein
MVTNRRPARPARYRSNRRRRGHGTNVLSCWLPTSCYLVRYSFVIHSLCTASQCDVLPVLPCWPLLSSCLVSCLVSLSFAIHSLSTLGRAGRTLENAQNNLVLIILCALAPCWRAGVPCVLAVPCSRALGGILSWRLALSWPLSCRKTLFFTLSITYAIWHFRAIVGFPRCAILALLHSASLKSGRVHGHEALEVAQEQATAHIPREAREERTKL